MASTSAYATSISIPPPWHAEAVVDRAIKELERGVAARTARLNVALARTPARNRIAVERLFQSCDEALRPDISSVRYVAVRHSALLATALTPRRPTAANDNEPRGIALQRLLCIAGKKLDWRAVRPNLEVGYHALARFVERSGHSEMANIQGAILEAGAAADYVLLAHCGPALCRLGNGVAPVLLPAGNGAFLGHIRLLPDPGHGAKPVLEAQTWLHGADLSQGQVDVRRLLTSNLQADEIIHYLKGVLGLLHSPSGCDRRLVGGLKVVAPGREPSPIFTMKVGSSQPAAAARLRLGVSCADAIAEERRAW